MVNWIAMKDGMHADGLIAPRIIGIAGKIDMIAAKTVGIGARMCATIVKTDGTAGKMYVTAEKIILIVAKTAGTAVKTSATAKMTKSRLNG